VAFDVAKDSQRDQCSHCRSARAVLAVARTMLWTERDDAACNVSSGRTCARPLALSLMRQTRPSLFARNSHRFRPRVAEHAGRPGFSFWQRCSFTNDFSRQEVPKGFKRHLVRAELADRPCQKAFGVQSLRRSSSLRVLLSVNGALVGHATPRALDSEVQYTSGGTQYG
jgi:hypothetical protein